MTDCSALPDQGTSEVPGGESEITNERARLRRVTMHTVPYLPGVHTPLPGGIWRDLVKVRDALGAGVADPVELRRLVCSCSTLERLVALGLELCMFDEPEAC